VAWSWATNTTEQRALSLGWQTMGLLTSEKLVAESEQQTQQTEQIIGTSLRYTQPSTQKLYPHTKKLLQNIFHSD